MMEISDPAAIAKLSKSQIKNGRTFFSQVWSLNNGIKRRRLEICAAVDGDSISVYEVNNGRNPSSCTIPPDSVLSCPPCSLRLKSHAGKVIRYAYYVATRRNTTELSVYQEEQDESTQRPVLKSVALKSDVPVAQIDVLQDSESHYVLAVFEDGHFLVYNADLSVCVRRGYLQHRVGNSRFMAAQWILSQKASQSVLKARPDLLTTLDQGRTFVVGVSVESDATSTGAQSIGYGIWQLLDFNSASPVEQSSEPILYHKFSIPSSLLPKERDPIVFAGKDNRLLVKTHSKVYVIDLTSIAPHITQEISTVAPDQLSSIYLSDSLTLSSTSNTIQLHNTQFKTLQTKLEYRETGLKRKRAHGPGGPIIFVAFFLGLGRVIATRHEQLIAIDLHVVGSDKFSTATKQSSLLINNIGRGAVSQDRPKSLDQISKSLVGQSAKSSEQVDGWHKSVEQLEQYIQQKKFTEFEKACVESLNSSMKNSSGESPILSNYKVDYVLSKIFEHEDSADDIQKSTPRGLKLAFPARKLLGLLGTGGFLTAERLSKVLRGNNRFNFESVEPGNISRVLVDNDRSLNVLRRYLEGAPHIAYQELCAALLLLLRRALAESSDSSPLTITNGQPTLLQTEDAVSLQSISSKPSKKIASNTTTCLCIAVERLGNTAPGLLSIHMRDSFNQGEIIALVQFLRQQLFRSGYTRSLQSQLYSSPPASEIGSSIDDKILVKQNTGPSLGAMTSLLSSCVDAIGPLGILSFGDEEEFTQTLIPDLSSEIARATEAVQEAIFLNGILRETLRFVESTERNRTLQTAKEDGADDHKAKPGAIVTLYSEPILQGSFDQSSSILPLGLRSEDELDLTKVRKGDGKLSKRSVRDIGVHQDRLRGPYAFERLML